MLDELKQIIGASVLAIGFSFLPSISLAVDTVENITLPAQENCAEAAYISDQWNMNTEKLSKNDNLAYKKLICNSNREAFILIKKKDANFSYELVDHLNKKISEKADNMCAVIDKYCTQ
ncbi:MAG: hypothetical protein COC24_001905 [Alphaproteobacteria bacterium]|nr:hypothetical protein [Alphaproteobacteria bacterium]